MKAEAMSIVRNIYQTDAEWSKEDEKMLEVLISNYEFLSEKYREQEKDFFCRISIARDDLDMSEWIEKRLKSIRPQPCWKPSEEQMNRLVSIIAALRKDDCDDMADFLASLYHDLKKLM